MDICQFSLLVLVHLSTAAYEITGNRTHINSDVPSTETKLYMDVTPFPRAISMRWDLTSYDYITEITAKYNVTPSSLITISNITRYTKEVNITRLPANRAVTVCLLVSLSNAPQLIDCRTKTTLKSTEPLSPVNNAQQLSIEATITLSVLIILIVAIAILCIIFARYQKKKALKRQQARALRVRARIQGRVSQDPKKGIGKLTDKPLPLDQRTLTEDWSVSSEVKVQDWQQNRVSLDFEPPSDAPVVDTEDLVFFQKEWNGKVKHSESSKSSSLNSQSKSGSKTSDDKAEGEDKQSQKTSPESQGATPIPEAHEPADKTHSIKSSEPKSPNIKREQKKTSRKAPSGPPKRKTIQEKLKHARKLNARANKMSSKSGSDKRTGHRTSSGKRRSSRTAGGQSKSSNKHGTQSGERDTSHSTSKSKSQPSDSHEPTTQD